MFDLDFQAQNDPLSNGNKVGLKHPIRPATILEGAGHNPLAARWLIYHCILRCQANSCLLVVFQRKPLHEFGPRLLHRISDFCRTRRDSLLRCRAFLRQKVAATRLFPKMGIHAASSSRVRLPSL